MCNKASIRAYPTLRYYKGRAEQGAELYTSKDIKEREADRIVMIVKQLMKQNEEEIKPVVNDINRPPTEESGEDIVNDDYEHEEEDENFVYFYEDDEEGTTFHDEL